MEHKVFVVDPGPEVLAAAPIYRDMQSTAERVQALAEALAVSPGFKRMADAVLVARIAPPARVALIGRFSVAETKRIESLTSLVESGLRRLRYVSYAEAERTAVSLADRLLDALGEDAKQSARFVALPRGGLLVLGMLSYLLDLRSDQLIGGLDSGGASPQSTSAANPLVVVDDCALTGLRFSEALDRLDSPAVVFAHLFSHPDLRHAIERREPRVVRCLAGADLRDMADERFGSERKAWSAKWLDRSDERAFWVGLPEHVCFPWNEPDITVWNPVTEREEAPWRLVPPAWCLKNQFGSSDSGRLQLQPPYEGPLRPADGTVIGELDGEIVAADVNTGKAHSFPGVSGEIFMGLLAHGRPELVAEQLGEAYDVTAERLRSDVQGILERVIDLGLLERSTNSGAGS